MGGIRGDGEQKKKSLCTKCHRYKQSVLSCKFNRNFLHLEAFFAGLAKFDLTYPLRFEDLSGRKTTCGVGIQDGVDDIATASL
jgi:hypothetical protein